MEVTLRLAQLEPRVELLYSALRQAGVPCELRIYEKGRHGVGLGQNDPALSSWPPRLEAWLAARGYTKASN